jgi:hypothetical protein
VNAAPYLGTAGALLGVLLGGWLAGRSATSLQRLRGQEASAERLEAACVEFLSAYRQFRRFLQTQPLTVELVGEKVHARGIPVINGAAKYWEAVESATAHIQILSASAVLARAIDQVRRSFYDLARARTTAGPGDVPDETVQAAKRAELQFAQAVQEELNHLRRPGGGPFPKP